VCGYVYIQYIVYIPTHKHNAALQVERDDGRGRVEHSTMMYEEAMSYVHKVTVCWCLLVSWCGGMSMWVECWGVGLCVSVCVLVRDGVCAHARTRARVCAHARTRARVCARVMEFAGAHTLCLPNVYLTCT